MLQNQRGIETLHGRQREREAHYNEKCENLKKRRATFHIANALIIFHKGSGQILRKTEQREEWDGGREGWKEWKR